MFSQRSPLALLTHGLANWVFDYATCMMSGVCIGLLCLFYPSHTGVFIFVVLSHQLPRFIPIFAILTTWVLFSSRGPVKRMHPQPRCSFLHGFGARLFYVSAFSIGILLGFLNPFFPLPYKDISSLSFSTLAGSGGILPFTATAHGGHVLFVPTVSRCAMRFLLSLSSSLSVRVLEKLSFGLL
jgi:hypothetical protein